MWIAAQFGWIVLWVLAEHLPGNLAWLAGLLPAVLLICVPVLLALTVRSLMNGETKRLWLVWGTLALLACIVLALGGWFSLDLCFSGRFPHRIWLNLLGWALGWLVLPAIFIPLTAASAQWGWRLPWRRVLHVAMEWRWWLGVLSAAIVGVAMPELILNITPAGEQLESGWNLWMKLSAVSLLEMGSWVALLGWVAVMFGRQKPQQEPSLPEGN